MASSPPRYSPYPLKYGTRGYRGMRPTNNTFAAIEDQDGPKTAKRPRQCGSFMDFVTLRQYETVFQNPLRQFSYEIASHMPQILQESEYDLGRMNKIFASKWINNDKQIVFGTKCNQVLVLDADTGRRTQIPSLLSSDQSIPAPNPCGIHSIAINPSQTLLATGASNTNDVAVYKLPTFDPVCVGELGHMDWIFDLQWLDDEYLVSGSRDGLLALWKMDSEDDGKPSRLSSLFIPEYAIKHPREKKECTQAERIRALAYDQAKHEMATISLNGYFHLWNMDRFCQVMSKQMTGKEHVCVAYHSEAKIYAIGSQSYVSLCDVRTPLSVRSNKYGPGFTQIESAYEEKGVRSVGFNDDVITIGTGAGTMFFYDMRVKKYIARESTSSESSPVSICLRMGTGWLRSDEGYREFLNEYTYPNAVFTHCYDSKNSRLFAAGGPLPSGLWGNYAGLWW